MPDRNSPLANLDALPYRGAPANLDALPYRGVFGDPRPPAMSGLALPPTPMSSHHGLRPLKAWRYVGAFGPELMLCVGVVRVGPLRQSFWAVWNRAEGRLHERTSLGTSGVRLERGRARVLSAQVQLDLALEETAGIEAVCPTGRSYAWTRKQGGVPAHGTLRIAGGPPRTVQAAAVIDDTAAYYARHTSWQWCAGVGHATDGRAVAWNLVSGVNDPAAGSERTIWIEGRALEAPPCAFAPDLSRVEALRFIAEATRERRDNLLIVRSSYRQPFGRFEGELPGGIELAEGYGVMESHDARW